MRNYSLNYQQYMHIVHCTCTQVSITAHIFIHTDSAFLISILMPILNVLLFFSLHLLLSAFIIIMISLYLCVRSESVFKFEKCARDTVAADSLSCYYVHLLRFHLFTVCHSAVSGGLCFVFQSQCTLRRLQSHKSAHTLYLK